VSGGVPTAITQIAESIQDGSLEFRECRFYLFLLTESKAWISVECDTCEDQRYEMVVLVHDQVSSLLSYVTRLYDCGRDWTTEGLCDSSVEFYHISYLSILAG
jgi:predicted metal-dependent enzyme (double-stranded beta helix superfamily)